MSILLTASNCEDEYLLGIDLECPNTLWFQQVNNVGTIQDLATKIG